MADAAQSTLPLQGEMQLVNYINSLFGGKTLNPNYTGDLKAPVSAPMLGSADMSNIMTEWLRGNGQFLDNMRQQNVSGLYNSSSQKLIANDLIAQAALKASTANQNIAQSNAQALNTYYSRLPTIQPKYLPQQSTGSQLAKLAAALGVDYLNSKGKGKKGDNALDKILGGIKDVFSSDAPNMALPEGGFEATKTLDPFSSGVISEAGATGYGPMADVGFTDPFAGVGFDLGSGFGNTDMSGFFTDPWSTPGMSSNFDFSNPVDFGGSFDFGNTIDFGSIGDSNVQAFDYTDYPTGDYEWDW